MNMKMFQEMAPQQKLMLTPQMQQSLKILQMPLVELQQNIERELAENPVLEVAQKESAPDEENVFSEDAALSYAQYIQDMGTIKYDHTNVSQDEYDQTAPLNLLTAKGTLKDYLVEQLLDLDEDEQITLICKYIIENIDARGYLSCKVEEIASELKVPVGRVNYALKLVQDFQPWGIGARDLKECLKIQLRKKRVKDEHLYKLVEECLELMANNKMKEMARRLKVDIAKVQEYCSIIKTLEPKPSRGFYTGNSESYIIPEAYIRKIGNDFYVLMNENALPRLTVNQLYKDILTKQEDRQVLSFVKDKLKNAVFFIKSIEQRKRTLSDILEKIVELQKEYFEFGENELKPMTIGDVAAALNIHESTVSRAIRDKYICTPFNTIKIKDLFTTGVGPNGTAGNIAVQLIKKEIRRLIDDEDKTRPLSDQDICNILQNMNIIISRRTVAKYREEMKIGSSDKRKTY